MDYNYLYWRRGVSLARAGKAACDRSRAAHIALFHAYDARIVARRKGAEA